MKRVFIGFVLCSCFAVGASAAWRLNPCDGTKHGPGCECPNTSISVDALVEGKGTAACAECCEDGSGGCKKCEGNGKSAGTSQANVNPLSFYISLGVAPPNSAMPDPYLRIYARTPTDSLYTRQGVTFGVGFSLVDASTNDLNSSGVPKHVTLLTSSKAAIVYEFADNVATGVPIGSDSTSLDRLVMKDANGAAVVSDPRFYDLLLNSNGGTSLRYGADPGESDYKDLVSSVTQNGRESTLEDSGIQVVKDSEGILRQLSVPMARVDFVDSTNESYKIRFYAGDQKGTWNPTNQLFESLGTPYVTYRVKNIDDNTNAPTTLISEIRTDKTNECEYTYLGDFNWNLEEGAGLVSKTRTELWDANQEYMLETETVKNDQNEVIAISSTKYFSFPCGLRRVEETRGSGASAQTDAYSYYVDSSETGRYGRVKSLERADGSWTSYDYDLNGRKVTETKGWLDAAYGEDGSIQLATFSYAEHITKDVVEALESKRERSQLRRRASPTQLPIMRIIRTLPLSRWR